MQTHIHIPWEDDWKVDTNVPSFECGGKCGATFITPTGDHWVKCGTADEMEADAKRRAKASGGNGIREVNAVISERQANPSLGCGVWYYNCRDEDYHMIRYCKKKRQYYNDKSKIITETCGDAYRRCTGHSKPSKGIHGGGSSSSLSPSNGLYAASAGDTHEANLNLSSVYTSLYWYVKSPSESGLGTNISTLTGDGSSKTASFSYTFSSSASGDYVITAYTYLSDGTIVQPNYTVSVTATSTDTDQSAPTYDSNDKELCQWCKMYGVEDGCGGSCIN